MGQRTIAKVAGGKLRGLLLVLLAAAFMATMAAGPANAVTVHNDDGSRSSVILVSDNSSFDTFSFGDDDALDLDDVLDFGDLVDVDVDGADVDVDVNL